MNREQQVSNILDTTNSTRTRGDINEDIIVDVFDKYAIIARKTKGSGSVHGDNDVIIERFNLSLDSKVKGLCQNINVPYNELDKASKQAAASGRFGAIVVPIINPEETDIEEVICLKLTDFIKLMIGDIE